MHFLSICVLGLTAFLAVCEARNKMWGTPAERAAIMEEAMSEAKLSAQLKDEARKAKAEENKNKPVTAQDLLNKGFKKGSTRANQQGRARLMLEDMVRRAERKLEELKRKNMAKMASAEEKAEMLGEELYHRPGSLLTEDEFAQMYIESNCKDSRAMEVKCNEIPTLNQFRTISGVCNNIQKKLLGAQGIAFRRLAPAAYEDGNDELRGFLQAQKEETSFQSPNPSARLISKSVVRDVVACESPFTHLLMQFGQFLDHDLDLGPEFEDKCEDCNFTEKCSPIRVEDDDLTFGDGTINNGKCLPFHRTIPVCDDPIPPGSFSPREQINDITSFIDGSMIYGSTEKVERAVRLFEDGLLKTGPNIGDDRESLPVEEIEEGEEGEEEEVVSCQNRDPRDCFLCGDRRCNEQVSLTVMHTLWVREHNRIVKELKNLNSFWSDERLFQEGRKIVGGVIQKIVYYDYLPLILGKDAYDIVIGDYEGYDETVDPSVPNVFATAAYRYGHSLIQPEFPVLDANYNPLPVSPINLANMFFRPDQYAAGGGVTGYAAGWLTTSSRRVDEFINNVLTTQLFQTETGPGMDLAALNIQRSRDHGLPLYKVWRNLCAKAFPKLRLAEFENFLTALRLRTLHNQPENAELWVAGLAEERIENSLLGPTFACLFGLTFDNVRDGDRFYFEKPGVFTVDQLIAIKRATFSQVICDNTNLNMIQPNAFLSNQSNVSCTNSIPPLDLTPWQEDVCFVRIETSPADAIIASKARVRRRTRAEVFRNQDVSDNQCLPVPCPGPNAQNTLAGQAFGVPKRRDCEYRLPSQTSSQGDTFDLGTVADSDIHRTLAACSADTTPVVIFKCDGSATTAEEHGKNCNPEDPNYNCGLPDEVIEEIKKEYELDRQNLDENAHMQDAAQKQAPQSLEAQDKELLRELQDALKQLE